MHLTLAMRLTLSLFRSLSDGLEPRRPSQMKKEADLPNGETVGEDGMKTVNSTNEYVDEYGNKHITTTITRSNEDGSWVSTESHYSVRPAAEVERSTVDESPRQNDNSGVDGKRKGDEKHEGDRQRSWFWK